MPESRWCRACGELFTPAGRVGRPPAYCTACRASRRTDDRAWRAVRAQVLAEEPYCAVAGCPRPATTVDHIVPLSRGGARVARANLQAMCEHHNFSKGAKVAASSPDPVAVPTTSGRCIGDCPPHCPGDLGRWHLP